MTEAASEGRADPQTTSQASQHLELLPVVSAVGPWVYALIMGVVYVCGFVIVNANLAKSGVIDLDLANGRYLMGGATFAAFLLFFYLSPGRSIIFGKKWLTDALIRHAEAGGSKKWGPVFLVHSLLAVVFDCCFAAAAFSLLAFGPNESLFFYAALVVPMFLRRTIDFKDWDAQYPKATLVFEIFVQAFGIYVFADATADSRALTNLFVIYAAATFFLNQVMDRLERFRRTADMISSMSLYVITFLLSLAVSYGAAIYGYVNPRVGGPQSQAVSLSLTDDARKAVGAVWGKAAEKLDGRLIHQTSSHLYVEADNKTLRLRSEDVIAMVLAPASVPDVFKKYLGSPSTETQSALQRPSSAASGPSAKSPGADAPTPNASAATGRR